MKFPTFFLSAALMLCFSSLKAEVSKADKQPDGQRPQMLFSLNFDNNSLEPQVAKGNAIPHIFGRFLFKPGFKGSAAIFTPGHYLTFKVPGNLNPDAGTLEFRFKLLPVKDGRYKRHFLTLYTNESERYYLRQLTKNSFHGYLKGGDKGGASFGFPFSDLPKGSWHHYALNWKRFPGKKKTHITVYLDGIKVVDKTGKFIFPSFAKGNMIIGAYTGGSISLNGLIDEFKIYDNVVYTKQSYPKFFVFPPISRLEKSLNRIGEGLNAIPLSKSKQQAMTEYNKLKDELDKVKKDKKKSENYLKNYRQLNHKLDNLWEQYAAAGWWWAKRTGNNFIVMPVSCMKKVADNWLNPPSKQELPVLTSCGHEWSAFQLVILPRFKDVTNCTVAFDKLVGKNGEISGENIKLFKVGSVRQQNNSKKWADPIYPLEKAPFTVKAKNIQSIWVQIYVPKGSAPGIYQGKVKISGNGIIQEFPVTLNVLNFALPTKPRLRTAFGFAMLPLWNYYKRKNIPELSKKYLANMLKHKVSIKSLWLHGIYYDTTFLAPKIIKKHDGTWSMDFSDYDRQLDALLPLGLNTIKVGFRSWDGNYRKVMDKSKATRRFPYYNEGATARNQVKLLKLPVISPKTENFAKWLIKTWYDHLKQRGLEKMAYTYFVDEPSGNQFKIIETFCRWAHEVEPNLKNMITHGPIPSCPSVDIWCPITPSKTLGKTLAKKNKILWRYVCCAPISPRPNFFITQTALENRLPFWEGFQAGAVGFLYWETGRSLRLHHKDNVWERLGFGGSPGTEGDGFLVYPGKNGPINTIRFEYVRMGIQDVEYFMMLKYLIKKLPADSPLKKEAQKLLTIPNDLLIIGSNYCKDWRKFERKKQQVGHMIEKVQKVLKNKK